MDDEKPTIGEKVECDVCHQKFVKAYISTHRRRAHSIYKTKRPNRDALVRVVPKRGQYGGATLPTPELIEPGFKVLNDFIILEDQDGGIWLAERIK